MAEKKYIVCIRYQDDAQESFVFSNRNDCKDVIDEIYSRDSHGIDNISVYYGFEIKPIIKTSITIPEVIEEGSCGNCQTM